jgi:hypothetical protein
MKKNSNSQAAWALLTEGVTKSRLDAHKLQLAIRRIERLIEKSENKDDIYQVAGDLIQSVPKDLDSLISTLDRTSLALAKMGESFLQGRLSIDDLNMVEDATESASFGGNKEIKSIRNAFLSRKINEKI